MRVERANYLGSNSLRRRNKLPDASEQAGNVGFNEVGICSCRNPLLHVSFIGCAGEEENGRVLIEVADAATQFKAIETGQPRVQQIQVEAFFLYQ